MRRAQLLALMLAGVLMAGAFSVAQWIEARMPPENERVAPIFFPRVEVLRPALLGFDGVAANLLWLRTVQYFGGRAERNENFPQLYQLVDMTTSLDQHFLDAYQYGGLFLVIAKQFPQAIAIYEKGIAANPTEWQLPHDLGRLYYLELQDYESALRWWQVTDRLPGRPHYIPRFLIRLQAKTGHLETALELWQQMLERSDNEAIRATARREIQNLLKELEKSPHADQRK
jgi:pentatricopeptide repeat protein